MKPRRVLVTLELETDAKLTDLRRARWWRYVTGQSVIQAQANVIKKPDPA